MSGTGEYLCEDGMRSLVCPCPECLVYQLGMRGKLSAKRDADFLKKYGVPRKSARPGVKTLQACIRRLRVHQAAQRERAVVVLQRRFRVYLLWLMNQGECPICTRRIRWTEDTPHASIHPVCRECMRGWRRSCRSDKTPVTCPLCRERLPRPGTDGSDIHDFLPPSDSEESDSSDSDLGREERSMSSTLRSWDPRVSSRGIPTPYGRRH